MRKLEKNYRYLKNLNADFYNAVRNGQEQYPIEIEKTEDDNYIIIKDDKKCFLNSIYDVDRENEMMFKGVPVDANLIVIMGVGKGAYFEYLIENFENLERVILVEPNLRLFKNFLEHVDLEKKLRKINKFDFIVNSTLENAISSIINALEKSAYTSVGIVHTFSTRVIFDDYYSKLSQMMAGALETLKSSYRVSSDNVYKLIMNSMLNIKQDNVPIKPLFDEFGGKPAILVSAGPSLNENMKYLKEINDKAFIIACGSAIRILDKNGVKPHLRAVFSPHWEEMGVIDDLADYSIPLIYTDSVYFPVVREYAGPKFKMIGSGNLLSDYIYKLMGEEQTVVDIELTIANVVFDMLCRAGVSELIFIGQDMAFTNKRRYSDGANLDHGIEGMEDALIKNKDIYGDDIYTMPAFLRIKEAFERKIPHYMGQTIFTNCTARGLGIKDTEVVPIDTKLNMLDEIYDIDMKINDIIESYEQKSDYLDKLKEALDEMKTKIQQIYEINEERADFLKELVVVDLDIQNVADFIKEFEEVHKFEERLKEIDYYKNLTESQLDVIFKSIIRSFQYEGKDVIKQYEAGLNMIVRVTLELQKYCAMMFYLIEKVKDPSYQVEGLKIEGLGSKNKGLEIVEIGDPGDDEE